MTATPDPDAPRPRLAPSTAQRRLRLARRLTRTIDGVLALREARGQGLLDLARDREARLIEAAEVLAETLARLVVRDRLPPESRAPDHPGSA